MWLLFLEVPLIHWSQVTVFPMWQAGDTKAYMFHVWHVCEMSWEKKLTPCGSQQTHHRATKTSRKGEWGMGNQWELSLKGTAQGSWPWNPALLQWSPGLSASTDCELSTHLKSMAMLLKVCFFTDRLCGDGNGKRNGISPDNSLHLPS